MPQPNPTTSDPLCQYCLTEFVEQNIQWCNRVALFIPVIKTADTYKKARFYLDRRQKNALRIPHLNPSSNP
jgi:hypothetical protein